MYYLHSVLTTEAIFKTKEQNDQHKLFCSLKLNLALTNFCTNIVGNG